MEDSLVLLEGLVQSRGALLRGQEFRKKSPRERAHGDTAQCFWKKIAEKETPEAKELSFLSRRGVALLQFPVSSIYSFCL